LAFTVDAEIEEGAIQGADRPLHDVDEVRTRPQLPQADGQVVEIVTILEIVRVEIYAPALPGPARPSGPPAVPPWAFPSTAP